MVPISELMAENIIVICIILFDAVAQVQYESTCLMYKLEIHSICHFPWKVLHCCLETNFKPKKTHLDRYIATTKRVFLKAGLSNKLNRNKTCECLPSRYEDLSHYSSII